MLDFRFEAEVDEESRIVIPPEMARDIPPHTRIRVAVHIPRGSNGALSHYMQHPLKMPGVLPFDRDEIYRDRT